MMRRPEDYGYLLRELLVGHEIKVWLVNTGQYDVSYGVDRRYDLHLTRDCIRAVKRDGAQGVRFTKDSVSNLSTPDGIGDIESLYFHPETLWEKQSDYFTAAQQLKDLIFDETYRKHLGSGPGVQENFTLLSAFSCILGAIFSKEFLC